MHYSSKTRKSWILDNISEKRFYIKCKNGFRSFLSVWLVTWTLYNESCWFGSTM